MPVSRIEGRGNRGTVVVAHGSDYPGLRSSVDGLAVLSRGKEARCRKLLLGTAVPSGSAEPVHCDSASSCYAKCQADRVRVLLRAVPAADRIAETNRARAVLSSAAEALSPLPFALVASVGKSDWESLGGRPGFLGRLFVSATRSKRVSVPGFGAASVRPVSGGVHVEFHDPALGRVVADCFPDGGYRASREGGEVVSGPYGHEASSVLPVLERFLLALYPAAGTGTMAGK